MDCYNFELRMTCIYRQTSVSKRSLLTYYAFSIVTYVETLNYSKFQLRVSGYIG